MELTFDYIQIGKDIWLKREIISLNIYTENDEYGTEIIIQVNNKKYADTLKTTHYNYPNVMQEMVDEYDRIKYLVNEWRYLNGRKDFIE